MRIQTERKIVGVNVLRQTSPEKRAEVTDRGRFVHDLAEQGLRLVLTNRDTFDTGEVLFPILHKGEVAFAPGSIAPGSIVAMHNRLVHPLKAPAAEAIPLLNYNAIKSYASSKYRLNREITDLGSHQEPTEFVSASSEVYTQAERILDLIDSSAFVIKSDSGIGGGSTKFVPRDSLADTLEKNVGSTNKDYIVQPKINFGELPESVRGVNQQDKDMIKLARQDKLLTELRMIAIKDDKDFTTIPVLRIVLNKGGRMGDQSDKYVDITLDDELYDESTEITQKIIDDIAQRAGNVPHVLAAVDFYFDKAGKLGVMEANVRSPQIPRTYNNPVSGRRVHKALADVLFSMSKSKGGRQ